jgi:hypothetical protein
VSEFVEDAAESIASSDVEAAESVRFGDRLGERRGHYELAVDARRAARIGAAFAELAQAV